MKLYLMKNNNHLSSNGYTLEDEEFIYDFQLEELFNNPRWYLDNLEFMVSYRLSWGNYKTNNPVLPRKFVKEHNKNKKIYK